MKVKKLCWVLVLLLLFGLAAGCGDDSDDDDSGQKGTLVFTLNAEDFVREGFVSEDNWRIDFEHVYINIDGPTAFQVADRGEEAEAKLRPEEPRAHAGHPHAEIPEGAANEALLGTFQVDGHQGTGPIELGKLENVDIGNYNYMNFNISKATSESEGYVDGTEGYSIVMIGTAKNNDTDESVDFTIKLTEEMEFTSCGPHPENIGVVDETLEGEAQATFHFDHIFGDYEEGPADTDDENTINYLAVGFGPFAALATDGVLDVTQADLKAGMEKYYSFVAALVTLGHYGEAHCNLHAGGVDLCGDNGEFVDGLCECNDDYTLDPKDPYYCVSETGDVCDGHGHIVTLSQKHPGHTESICRCDIGYKGSSSADPEDLEHPDGCTALESGDVAEEAERRFMTAHGIFELTPETEGDVSVDDPRNPKRVVMQSLAKGVQYSNTVVSFTTHESESDFAAENCHYQYAGSLPDPFYFSQGYFSSVWDLYELLVGEDGDCSAYAHLALRSPHGNDTDGFHMHMRYGDAAKSFEALLAMSNDAESGYDPWWSHYVDSSGETPDSLEFNYTNVNGIFEMDSVVDSTMQDSRNPAKMSLETALQSDPVTPLSTDGQISRFVFYTHADGATVWADCNYKYVGAEPDPYYTPQHKHSVWDLFEQTSANEGDCADFHYAVFRSPHSSPQHVHFRYGPQTDNFDGIINMSLDAENTATYDPWWSTYCSEGVSGCD